MAGIQVEALHAWYGRDLILKQVDLVFPGKAITAVIGPSGCGKSTLLRCLNRMHELVPGARVAGRVVLNETDIYHYGVNPVEIRRRVGMVFQNPNIFPTMTIFQNVGVGLALAGRQRYRHRQLETRVVKSLQQVGLWEEVKDRLHRTATGLSAGQLQRLCIARTLAVEPEVLLMDEPCSALDPIAAIRIEELMRELKASYTIILVTHNMQQAARVADFTAFISRGELIEYGSTPEVFLRPRDLRTERYITGTGG
jgi:phosphate transport system ATP-binding protein